MKFRYKKYGPGILRPVIPIEISFQNRSVPYEVLVDSGADFCIFDAEIGELLGIDIKNGEPQRVSGITGTIETYYVHPITVKVGGWSYSIKAGFLPNIAPLGYGVVGQKGFFDIFVVKFDLIKEEIELKERK
ncbi:MAG: aspartyl protease family protein [Candidatus Colwellbacteria bacterium]|nr:aspartyl protease family protein [Candidatus Colwellbacteria bacterium]MBI3089012.1 aspartyl protease family protein [Candidatus Colwellbacteria bacterium]